MILFMDDCPDRVKIFMSYHPRAVIMKSSKTMIELLSQVKPIQYLFLDHDLFGDEAYVPGKVDGTGMEVVEWLENNKLEIYQIVVHSRNGHAAPKMLERLLAAGYWAIWCPFYDLLPQFERARTKT